jgi:MSHA type pilus biogenesis protein MshL
MNDIHCKRLSLPVLCLFLGIAAGCSVPAAGPRPVAQDELAGQQEKDPHAVLGEEMNRLRALPGPPPFTEKLEPIRDEVLEETKLFSLLFDEAPLGEVLSALIQDTDLNLSVEAGVDLSRTVTVHLKTVTFVEALNMVVVKGADYAWKKEDGCLHINRFDERIYHLDYLDLVGDTQVEVGGDMLSSSVEDAGVIAKFQVKGTRSSERSDVWTAVEHGLEGLKSAEGTVRMNRNAGLIYLVDTPRRVAAMTRFLDDVSDALKRQVFIQAKIFEVTLDDEHQYGIDWESMQVGFESSSSDLPDIFNVFVNGGGRIFRTDTSELSVTVDFLRTQGEISVLSSPHLSVMNGQSAVMTVGFQFPFGDVDGVDRDAETGLVTYGTSIKRVILGLQLGITPQISRDGMITLHIVPSITKIQGEETVTIPLTVTDTQDIKNPIIGLQEFSTTVRVRSGESVILAGLTTQSREQEHIGLPLLGSIPGLGNLFKHVEDKLENKELVVFISPVVREAL